MTFLPTILGSGVGALTFLNRTRDQQEETLRASSVVSRDIAAVQDRLTNIQTADELLDDRQVLAVVLGSFGLEDEINNRGFLRNVLLSDLNDPASVANRLGEPKYRDLAQAFNFGGTTGATFPGAAATDTLAPQLQALASVDDLFEEENSRLLTRALEVFDIEADADRTVFLKQILQSDLSDSTSLVNRVGDQRYIDFVAAFQNDVDRLPEALRGKVSDRVATTLRAATTGADITADRRVLGAVLTQFGLQDQINNKSLIEAVLNSDLTDPKSVANRLSDTRYQDLARAFDLAGRRNEAGSIYALADLAEQRPDSLASADALLADDDFLNTALTVFGLDPSDPDKAFLKTILEADPDDAASVVNEAENAKYLAFAKAFDFGEQLARPDPDRESRIDRLVQAVSTRNAPPTSASSFSADSLLFLAATNLFDLPQGADEAAFARRVLASDPLEPLSSYQLAGDDNYRHLVDALNFQPEVEGYQYPNGFADAIVNSYIERQFEISVGQRDNDMRLMLSLERDLGTTVSQVSTNDGRWFRVMGTPSLRAVFDGAFGLPPAFAQLEVDRQLEIFKEKSEEIFGTSDLEDLAQPENLAELQRRYLALSSILGANAASAAPASPIFSLLV